MAVESVSEELLRALGEYIDRRIRFKQVIHHWPDYQEKLRLPTLSLTMKEVKYTPFDPFELKRINPETARADVLYVSGDYEIEIQADIWVKTKAERADALEKFFSVFHSQKERVSPTLSLTLSGYHDVAASYHLGAYRFVDSGEASTAAEWRVLFDITAQCAAIVMRDNEPIITELEANPVLSTGPEGFDV